MNALTGEWRDSGQRKYMESKTEIASARQRTGEYPRQEDRPAHPVHQVRRETVVSRTAFVISATSTGGEPLRNLPNRLVLRPARAVMDALVVVARRQRRHSWGA
jgi:hypothetical protein